MAGLTVLIVDDHAGFRTAAHELLTRHGFDVLAEAGDGTTALAMAAALSPVLVLLDVRLPDLDGFEVSRRLRAVGEGSSDATAPTVVLVSTREAADYGRRIERSGAAGFITKADLTGDTLLAVLRGQPEERT